VAGDTRSNVVVAGVGGASSVDVNGLGARDAIEHIAREVGASVTDHRGVLLVRADGPSLPRAARVTLKAGPLTVREFAKQLHARTGVDFLVADDIGGRVTCDVVDVPWFALLQHVAGRLQFDVVGCGSVLALRRHQPGHRRIRVGLELPDRAVGDVFSAWARVASANVVVDPAATGRVSVWAWSPDERGLVAALARAVGCEAVHEERGIVIVRPTIAVGRTTTWTAAHLTARELATLCADKGEPPPAMTDSTLTMTLFADNADVADVLAAIAAVTEKAPVDGGAGPNPK
jgi:hypothetical protein